MKNPMSKAPLDPAAVIAVLCGGIGSEREISLVSGRAVAEALSAAGPLQTVCFELEAAALPGGLDPGCHVIFPVFHGRWGEDGGVQNLLDAAGFAYAGCGAEASRLCMDKPAAKARVATAGVPVIPGRAFEAHDPPAASSLTAELGEEIVLKPSNEGSSVGLQFCSGEAALAGALEGLAGGRWLAERRVRGRELTVGILAGEALGVVEIVPSGGAYDYRHKYTRGLTEYRYPAPLPEAVTARLRELAAAAFAACGGRDFARVDFLLEGDQRPFFLEINTIPGLTPTSLLPKSAACQGLDFPTLARRMIEPALRRFALTAATL